MNKIKFVSLYDYYQKLPYNINTNYECPDFGIEDIKNSIITEIEDANIQEIIEQILSNIPSNILELIIIDNEKLNLSEYIGIPHIKMPIISEENEVIDLLEKLEKVINNRIRQFINTGAKNISIYNDKIAESEKLRYVMIFMYDAYIYCKYPKVKDLLIKILMNGEKVGIKIMMLSRCNVKNIQLRAMQDLINIYIKCDINKIFGIVDKKNDASNKRKKKQIREG